MIECQDLIKIYTDPELHIRVAALRGIDLRVNIGEIISIVGPSGSGKSTLIKVLAGIESISSGIAHVNGFELEKMSSNELLNYRLHNVGMVHQFPERTLFLNGTVMDNLLFSASLHSSNREENRREGKKIIQELNIGHLVNRRVGILSGGEMIRTAIAFMLAKKVPLLLCDEPTGQLDSINTEIVKETLKQIAHDFKSTVLVVTHDRRFMKGVDRFCEIQDGRVSILIKPTEDLQSDYESFPIIFDSHIDSSHSIRIPDIIYDALRLRRDARLILTEDFKVELAHPEGIEPKKDLQLRIHKMKNLVIKSLPDDYTQKNEVVVELKDVSKIYGLKGNEVHALCGINLQVHKGELVFVIGPSGSGKTTLVKLLTGMEATSQGEITIFDSKLHKMTDIERARFRRKKIGIVSQQGDLHPFLTVTENLFLKKIFSLQMISPDENLQTQVDQILSELEITHRRNAHPLDISGGELQRASMAIAQFETPPILIFDEPTANMDFALADKVMKRVFDTHEKLKSTLIITTHDINLVKEDARVIELLDGKISKDGLATINDRN